MELLSVGMALGLPWLAGVVWLRRLWRPAQPGGWPAALGYGYVLGMLATTLLLRGMSAAGLPLAFGPTALGLALLAAAAAWRRRPVQPAHASDELASPSAWERAASLALLCMVVGRLAGLGLEALTSPLFGWDAWASWAPKARVFFELRRIVPFVGWEEWLLTKSSGAYTLSAAHYPATVPLLQTWTCLALGRWDDSLIALPWLGCAAALGLSFYGQARLWGAAPLASMTFTYLLTSLPLFDTQVAIPGIADLWMATLYGLASFSFFQWARTGDARHGILASGLAVACALIKVPGIVWMLTFPAAVLLARLSRAALLRGLALLVVLPGAVLAAGGFHVELPLLGGFGLTPRALDLPYLGHYPLAFRPEVFWAFCESAFSLASWHLLWYGLCGVALLRWRLLLGEPGCVSMAWLVLVGLCFVGGVYSLTQHAEFALDFTQLNRTALHMVPTLLFVAMAAWVRPTA